MNWETVITVANERLPNKFKKEASLSSKRNQLGKLQLSKNLGSVFLRNSNC